MAYTPSPLYGADMEGTLFDEDVESWNLRNLHTVLEIIDKKIPGINQPYLYFGMWKAMFSWHTEDMDLYSINYLHYGASKTWYATPPQHGKQLEKIASEYFPNLNGQCENFLRHKTTLISPYILSEEHKIPIFSTTQNQGEFIITFPYAYHSGFNHGFNCAESVNFGHETWFEYGRKAVLCSCQPRVVYINMYSLEARCQLKKENEGKDITPEILEERVKQLEKNYESLISEDIKKKSFKYY